MKRLSTVGATVLLALSFALPAQAAREDHSSKLIEVLSAIDTVPTKAGLEAVCEDAPAELFAAAADTDLHSYQRRRATSLLSGFPTSTVESYLTWLAATTSEAKLRWMASYTYVRTFGTTAASRVLDFAEVQLRSPIASDRDAVVRALRHVPGKRAGALLEKAERTETDPMVRGAIKRARATR